MDKTPDQILKEESSTLVAMEVYAKQEAFSFAGWLSNQVINGRTITKLWADYKKELGRAELVRIECKCPCHSGSNIKHFAPCCNDGYIEFPKSLIT